jgi:hypothetical protein
MRGSPSWRPEVGLMERDASVQKTTRVGVAVAQGNREQPGRGVITRV